jgi:hypothetical protein
MRDFNYMHIKDKQQKQKKHNELATEDVVRLSKPELHDNAPKEVTIQSAAVAENLEV